MKKVMMWMVVAMMLIVIMVSCSKKEEVSPTEPAAPAVPTATPVGGGKGKIAFLSYRDGNDEIYVMEANGSNQTNLTNNSADDWYPVWSPDGTKIAFQSYRVGNDEIYVMDANGSNQMNLTNNNANDYIVSIYNWK